MAPHQLTLCKDAIDYIDLNYSHPLQLIRGKFPSRQMGNWLENCQVIGLKAQAVSRKEQLVVGQAATTIIGNEKLLQQEI